MQTVTRRKLRISELTRFLLDRSKTFEIGLREHLGNRLLTWRIHFRPDPIDGQAHGD